MAQIPTGITDDNGRMQYQDDGQPDATTDSDPIDKVLPEALFKWGSTTGGLGKESAGATSAPTPEAQRDSVLQDIATRNGISMDDLKSRIVTALGGSDAWARNLNSGFGPVYLPNEFISNMLSQQLGFKPAYSDATIQQAQKKINDFGNDPRNANPSSKEGLTPLKGILAVGGAALGGAASALGGAGGGLAEEAASLGISDLGSAGINFGSSGNWLTDWLGDTGKSWIDNVKNFFTPSSNASPAVDAVGDTAGKIGQSVVSDTANSAAPSLAENTTGVTPNAQRFLVADSDTVTDVPQGLQGEVAPPPSSETGAFDQGQFTPQDVGLNPASQQVPNSTGIINQAMDFAKKNPTLTSGALQVAGGLLKGVGDRSSALEIADKKIAADKALLSQKTQEAINLENAKRQIIQGSSYFGGNLGIKPASNALRRPDGSLVYAPQSGLIARAMA